MSNSQGAAFANQAPDQRITENTAFGFELSTDDFSDPSGELSYSVSQPDGSPLPAWLSFDPSTMAFTGTAPAGQGVTGVVVTATGSDGTAAQQAFHVYTVAPSPVLEAQAPDHRLVAGQGFSFALPASSYQDPQGGTLTYSATQTDGTALPSWVSFDAATGTFSGTAPANAGVVQAIEVTATTTQGVQSAEAFHLYTVYGAALADQQGDVRLADRTAFSFQIPNDSFTDLNGGTLYSATQADGSALPSWISFDPSTGTFSGTSPDATGVQNIVVTATGPYGEKAAEAFNIYTTATGPALTDQEGDQRLGGSQAFSFTLPTDSFTDKSGTAVTYSVTQQGGAALPSWVSFDAATDTFSGTTPAAGADLHIVVTATGSSGIPAAEAFHIYTTDAGPVLASQSPDQRLSGDAAFSFTLPASTFTDAAGETLTYAATQADGSALPSWLTFDAATQTFSGTAPDATAVQNVVVSATDARGVGVAEAFNIYTTQARPALAVQSSDVFLPAGAPGDVTVDTLSANTFTAPAGESVTYSAASDDSGTALPSWVSFDAATQTFTIQDQNAAGVLKVVVTATSSAGGTSAEAFHIYTQPDAVRLTDQEAGQTATGGAPFSFTLPADSFAATGGEAVSYAATLADGSALPSWLSFDPSTATFSGTAPIDAADLSLDVTATSPEGGTGSETFSLSTTDAPPVLASQTADQSVSEGAAVSFVLPAGTFADAAGGALTYSASVPVAEQNASDMQISGLSLDGSTIDLASSSGFVAGNTTQLSPSGANSYQVVTADLNSNGQPGLFMPDYYDSSNGGSALDVAAANGDGTYTVQPEVDSQSEAQVFKIATGDFNGDGNLDVVTAGFGGQDTVLLGDGQGGFAADGNFSTGRQAPDVVTGDFNGDGNLDFASVESGGVQPVVFLGDGMGGFTQEQGQAVANSDQSEVLAVTSADVNGDGALDLVSYGYLYDSNTGNLEGEVNVMLGNGDGTFQAPVTYTTGQDVYGYDIQAADLTKGGLPDLILSDTQGGTVEVLMNNGDGTFQAPVSYDVSGEPWNTVVADMNGDGIPDLVVSNEGTSSVQLLLGNGDGTFQAPTDIVSDVNTTAVALTSVNGRPALLVNNQGYGTVTTYLSQPAGGSVALDASNLASVAGTAPAGQAAASANAPQVLSTSQSVTTDGTSSVVTYTLALSKAVAVTAAADGSMPVLTLNGGGTAAYDAAASTSTSLVFTATIPAETGSLPSWLTFDPSTGTFTGTAPSTLEAQAVTVTATDAYGQSAAETFHIDVTGSTPVLAIPEPDQTLSGGAAFSFGLPAGSFTDADSNPSLSASTTDGSALPSWLSFDAATGTFSGTAPAASLSQEVLVTATGKEGQTNTEAFNIVVYGPPTASGFSDVTVTPDNGPITVTVPGTTFTDPASATPDYTYTATQITGAPLPSWLSLGTDAAGDAVFTGTAPDNSTAVSVALTATSEATGESASESFSIIDRGSDMPMVTDQEADQSLVGNAAFSFQLPEDSFTVDDGSALTYSATAADGSALPSWLTFDPSTQTFSGTAPVAASSVSVLVTATGAYGGMGSETFTVSNTDAPPVAGTPIGAQSVGEGQNVSLALPQGAFTDADPGSTLTYSASVPVADQDNLDLQVSGLSLDGSTVSSVPVTSFDGGTTSGGLEAYFENFSLLDLNGDGKLDVVAPNYDDGQDDMPSGVTSLLGDGTGAFADPAASGQNSGPYPYKIATGDFNKDGKADVVITTDSSNSNDVLLGNGDGTFTDDGSFGGGTYNYAEAVTTGDFNADGNLDFATVGNAGVSIFLGDGAGGFAETDGPANVSSTLQPQALATGHFTGDGNLDLVTYSYDYDNDYEGHIDVMLGNGDGTFQTPVDYQVGGYGYGFSLVTADLTHDGLDDIVFADSGQGSVEVMMNEGNGTFSAPVTVETGIYPYSVAVADMNGDGVPDIVVSNIDGSVDLIAGRGDGTFSAATPLVYNSEPIDTAVGDVNGDGLPDLVVDNYGQGSVTTYLNTSSQGGVALNASAIASLPTDGSTVPATSNAPTVTSLYEVLDPENGVTNVTYTVGLSSAVAVTAGADGSLPVLDLAGGATAAYDAAASTSTSLVFQASVPDESGALPSWLSIDPTTGKLTGTAPNALALQDVTVTATDQDGQSASQEFQLAVTGTTPVLVNQEPDQSVATGTGFSFTLPVASFVDMSTQPQLSASLQDGSSLPQWLKFDASTDTFSGTGPAAGVTADVLVTATGKEGQVGTESFNVTSYGAPTVASQQTDQTVSPDMNGGAFSLSVPATSFADPASSTPDYTYKATQADGSALPSWLGFSQDAGDNAVFSGTAPVNPATVGVTLTATSQKTGGSVSETFSFIDPGSDQPQLVSQTPDQLVQSGQPYSLDLGAASSIFSVPDGSALTYAATQANGSALPAGTTFGQSTAANPELTLSGTGGSSTLAVSVTATSPSGFSVADVFNVRPGTLS